MEISGTALMTNCITISTVLYVYLICSVFTMVLFAIDKHLATIQAYRISEKNLILASAICGWPGGILAIKLFHHKTNKLSFKLMMALAIMVNLTVLIFAFKLGNC